MNARLASVRHRRQQLVAKAAEQRGVMAKIYRQLKPRFALLDRGIAVVRFFRSHPLLILAASAILGLRRPGKLGKWALAAWLLRQGYEFIGSARSKFPGR